MTQPKLNSIAKTCSILHLIVLLLALSSCGVRQKELRQPSSDLPPAQLITQFNFDVLTGGIVILKARLGDHPDTLQFVLDTGSGGISLDSTTVEDLKLEKIKTNRTIRGIAGVRTISFVMQQTLRLPNLSVTNLDFHINDYDLLSSVYGVKIDGIIGYSFLSRYIVKLNYDKNVIEIWTAGSVKYPQGGYFLTPSIRNIPVIEAAVNDNTLVGSKFYLDTGAGLSLLLSERFVKDSSILKSNRRITYTQGEGLGGKKPMRLTTVKQFRLGPYRFRRVPLHIFEDDYNITAYPTLGGLVGNDLFRRFNIVINYPENQIHIFPNSHFNDPFDYSYTGLGIYSVRGIIIVEDVIEKSPGEQAGFKPGDIILGVGNNFSNNIQSYKNILQQVGKVKVVVLRNGEPLELILVVKSIL